LFSLNGTLGATTPADTPLIPISRTTSGLEAPDLARGAELYRQTCLPCHGDDGRGGHGGGAPLDSLGEIDHVVTIISDGVNNMPPFAAALTAQQILDVGAYVLSEFSPR
jgi:mono/diheme cytochrome c family protein